MSWLRISHALQERRTGPLALHGNADGSLARRRNHPNITDGSDLVGQPRIPTAPGLPVPTYYTVNRFDQIRASPVCRTFAVRFLYLYWLVGLPSSNFAVVMMTPRGAFALPKPGALSVSLMMVEVSD